MCFRTCFCFGLMGLFVGAGMDTSIMRWVSLPLSRVTRLPRDFCLTRIWGRVILHNFHAQTLLHWIGAYPTV
ncbi:hypothetical protein BJX65DRAFT_264783 [Aspergillus insuetus]